MDGSISPTPADLSKVVDLAALHTLLPIGRALSGWMAGTTITDSTLWLFLDVFVIFSDCVTLLLSVSCLTLLFYLDWLLLQTGLFGLPLFFAQTNTCSLVTAGLYLALVSSLIISASISFHWARVWIAPSIVNLSLYSYTLQLPM